MYLSVLHRGGICNFVYYTGVEYVSECTTQGWNVQLSVLHRGGICN